ncbi:hypothetical protein TI03_02630 [Achromatium sp. WMS1]|nr:hypothetical protein TI03_02630 [Achromatium sp. WMS1]
MKDIFVTGTDTGCGKTEITLALMDELKKQGIKVTGMKPVASGGKKINDTYYNEDALRIQSASSIKVPYELINPYVFVQPIAPHIAAAEIKQEIRFDVIHACFHKLKKYADTVIVEGVGGWKVPLTNDLQVADLPKLLNLPVLLVVGLRLGCINHALLTTHAILASDCTLIGWIANQQDPGMLRKKENIEALINKIDAPYLGYVPYGKRLKGTSTDLIVNWSNIKYVQI